MRRIELERYLEEALQYDKFDDYCKNGLQIEGKENIHKIAFGVSFNRLLLQEAVDFQADAIIVHHGLFGKNFLYLKGGIKEKIKFLLQHDITLFGIHLPLDAHPELGNNAQLFSYIDGEILEPYDFGFIGKNRRRYSLVQLLKIFHQNLHPEQLAYSQTEDPISSLLAPKKRYGFVYFDNGPEFPEKIAIISGDAADRYRNIENIDVDTFICGSIEEPTPAISYESQTNFVNLGHYWSEKPGILALQQAIAQQFDVETKFIEIENVI